MYKNRHGLLILINMRFISYALLLLFCAAVNAWNVKGHQLVAQIAYNHLNPKTKILCDRYNRAFSKGSSSSDFIAVAPWLDLIRTKDIHWYDSLHYIGIPFTEDNSPLVAVQDINALWAIKQALAVLASSKSSDADKGLSLRILIHVVGDIHQPLHTTTQVSKNLPRGDFGGNLFPLAKNSIGTNLHQYWDNGAGFLLGKKNKSIIIRQAQQIQNKWPALRSMKAQKNPQQWVKATHKIARNFVYHIEKNKKPGKEYQTQAKIISEQQILLAGYRLAQLLNEAIHVNEG